MMCKQQPSAILPKLLSTLRVRLPLMFSINDAKTREKKNLCKMMQRGFLACKFELIVDTDLRRR